MKFDAAVGNPPYQSDNRPIWKDFAALAIDRLAPVVAFVTPRSVLNGAPDDDFKQLQSNYYERIRYNLQLVDYSADNHFNVTKRICYWIYNANYTGDITLIDDDKNRYTVDPAKAPFLPYELTETSYRVYEYILSQPRRMLSWSVVTPDNQPNGPGVVLPKSKHISLVNMRWTTNVLNDPDLDASWVIVYPTPHANTVSYIHTKLFKYMFIILGGMDGNTYSLLRKMPELDYTHPWTDELAYAQIPTLTANDIEVIESATRPKRPKKPTTQKQQP